MSDCNLDCGCKGISYNPVCSNEDGFTNYFSPCHAGCKSFRVETKGQLISKCPFDVLYFPKNQLKNLMNFCPRIQKLAKLEN